MGFQKILCPIDFSSGSQTAMSVAVRLAWESDAELILVHAWHVPTPAFPIEYTFPSQTLDLLREDAQRGLDAAVRDAAALGAKRVSSMLLTGVPWRAIIDALDDRTFDLVVIGTHGRTGVGRILLGSVTEKVVRHSPCPVLTVRPDSESRPFLHVLCPVDFSDSSRWAVDLAAQLVQPGGAGITLLHVVEAPVPYAGELRDPELVRELDRRSAEHLEAWAVALRAKVTVPVTISCRLGWAGAETIAAIERDSTIDLVAMGSHGRTGLGRLFLGSVAEKVVRHAWPPVLVAHRRG